MSSLKVTLLGFLLQLYFLSPSQAYFGLDSLGQTFLEFSSNVDFSSSFYNDLTLFFPNFNPEGFTVFNNNQSRVKRTERSVTWDSTKPKFAKKYPVIKWESISRLDTDKTDQDNENDNDNDNDDEIENSKQIDEEQVQLLTPPETTTVKSKKKKSKKRIVIVENVEDSAEDLDGLNAPSEEEDEQFITPYHNPYSYQPRVSYPKRFKPQFRKKGINRYEQRPSAPVYQNDRVFDVGIYPKNQQWYGSLFRQGPYYGTGDGYGGYGQPKKPEFKKFPKFLLPWPFAFFIPAPVRRLPFLTLIGVSPILLIPFVPFGIADLRLPVGWDGNYLLERIYGFEERADTGRGFADEQFDLFSWLDGILSSTFAIDGKTCIKRLICELSEVPIKQISLMGEFVHYIFDPRKGQTKLLKEFMEAEKQGLLKGKCEQVYSRCPFSIRRLISQDYVNDVLVRKRR